MRKKVEAKDVADAGVDPTKTRLCSAGVDPGNQKEPADVEGSMDADEEDGIDTWNTIVPESDPGPQSEAIPVPDSTPLSEQFPSPQGSVGRQPDLGSTVVEIPEPSQATRVNRTPYDGMAWGQLHDECAPRGFRKKKLKAVSRTRLA